MTTAEKSRKLAELLKSIPYTDFLGITADRHGDEVITVLPFSHSLIGNPVLPALHGGVIGAFLETTAITQLASELETGILPKPIGITIDYLRSGRPEDTYARAIITRQGRRVATVRAEAWQEDRSRPIAAARGHFLLLTEDTQDK